MARSKSETPREPSPVTLLLGWSERKGSYAVSVVLAIIGVAGSIVPYFAAGNMVAGILDGGREWSFFLHWGIVAAVGYLVYLVFHFASTAISHIATFAMISHIRRLLAEKLVHVPMGRVLETPSGTLKSLMVEKVDSIEKIGRAHV